jgi:AraC-like DNA-binding protein
LQTPNKLGDASISKFFETHLEVELAKMEDDNSLDRKVRIQVSKSLSEGVPALSDIAGRLGMSGRTLQRRLAGLGFSYQDLVDESRRQLAKRLLQQTEFSLFEVAFMTGFSEQSAFTRAFKRWAGQTPRSFRIRSQSQPQ